MEDFRTIRKSLGLNTVEFGNLLGIGHAAVSCKEVRLRRRQSITNILYWFLARNPAERAAELLDFWIEVKPRDREHIRNLFRIARRFKCNGTEFKSWENAMRAAHPEFFPSERSTTLFSKENRVV